MVPRNHLLLGLLNLGFGNQHTSAQHTYPIYKIRGMTNHNNPNKKYGILVLSQFACQPIQPPTSIFIVNKYNNCLIYISYLKINLVITVINQTIVMFFYWSKFTNQVRSLLLKGPRIKISRKSNKTQNE